MASYEWETTFHPDDLPLAAPPQKLVDMLGRDRDFTYRRDLETSHLQGLDLFTSIAQGVGEGERHVAATRLAGHLLGHGIEPTVAEALLQGWNETYNDPPQDRADIARVVRDLAGNDAEGQVRELRSRTAAELVATVGEEPDWIVPDLVARGAITEIDGYVKVGKSHFIAAMAKTISQEGSFLE